MRRVAQWAKKFKTEYKGASESNDERSQLKGLFPTALGNPPVGGFVFFNSVRQPESGSYRKTSRSRKPVTFVPKEHVPARWVRIFNSVRRPGIGFVSVRIVKFNVDLETQ
jgi:hypothetical protein